MPAESIKFQCPLCTSVFILEKKAVRSEMFRCPVCQEGEIVSEMAEPENDWIARALLEDPGTWVVMPAPVETASRS